MQERERLGAEKEEVRAKQSEIAKREAELQVAFEWRGYCYYEVDLNWWLQNHLLTHMIIY